MAKKLTYEFIFWENGQSQKEVKVKGTGANEAEAIADARKQIGPDAIYTQKFKALDATETLASEK